MAKTTSGGESESIIRLGSIKVDCPDEGEDVATNNAEGIHMEFGYRRFQDQPHEVCHGTGRKPLFPGLRVECECCHDPTGEMCYCGDPAGSGPCKPCQARGWLPQPDGMKVLQSVWKWMYEQPGRHSFGGEYEDYRAAAARGDLPVALRAVEQACEEAGLLEKGEMP